MIMPPVSPSGLTQLRPGPGKRVDAACRARKVTLPFRLHQRFFFQGAKHPVQVAEIGAHVPGQERRQLVQ